MELIDDHIPAKADSQDFVGRFREIISDPLNLLIARQPGSGTVNQDGLVMLHNGNQVSVDGEFSYYGDFSRILQLNRGVHEPLEEFVFQEVMKRLAERPRMLELGAYWSHYSMWLKRCRPHAKVTLVEPNARNLAAGQRNFEINGYEGEFIEETVGRGGFSVDAFLERHQIEKLEVLHSDIQGYELEMLDDCKTSLSSRSIDYLFISTHSQELHTGVAAFISNYDYRIEVSSDYDTDSTSHDGLIFASSASIEPVFSNFQPMGRREIAGASPRQVFDNLSRYLEEMR